MSNSKADFRRMALQRRTDLDEQVRKCASVQLSERIMAHPWYQQAEDVLAFYPYGTEIDIREILQDVSERGKHLYLPKVLGDVMEFYRVESLENLEEGYKGIREPKGDTETYSYSLAEERNVIVLMPGAAFDKDRNRIGYGKGYYDKYLQDKNILQEHSIAVGFTCQEVEHIPADATDIKPCQVILV